MVSNVVSLVFYMSNNRVLIFDMDGLTFVLSGPLTSAQSRFGSKIKSQMQLFTAGNSIPYVRSYLCTLAL